MGKPRRLPPYAFLKEVGRKGNVGQYLYLLHEGLNSNVLKTTPWGFRAANQVVFQIAAASIDRVGLRSNFNTALLNEILKELIFSLAVDLYIP